MNHIRKSLYLTPPTPKLSLTIFMPRYYHFQLCGSCMHFVKSPFICSVSNSTSASHFAWKWKCSSALQPYDHRGHCYYYYTCFFGTAFIGESWLLRLCPSLCIQTKTFIHNMSRTAAKVHLRRKHYAITSFFSVRWLSDIDPCSDHFPSLFPTTSHHPIISILHECHNKVLLRSFHVIVDPAGSSPSERSLSFLCENSHSENRDSCTFSSAFPHFLSLEKSFLRAAHFKFFKILIQHNTKTKRSKMIQRLIINYLRTSCRVGRVVLEDTIRLDDQLTTFNSILLHSSPHFYLHLIPLGVATASQGTLLWQWAKYYGLFRIAPTPKLFLILFTPLSHHFQLCEISLRFKIS